MRRRLSHQIEIPASNDTHKDQLAEIQEWTRECVKGYYAYELVYAFEKHNRGYSPQTARMVSGIKAYFDRPDDAAFFKLTWYKS